MTILKGQPYPEKLVVRNSAFVSVGDTLALLIHFDELAPPDHDLGGAYGDLDAVGAAMNVSISRFMDVPWFAFSFPLTGLHFDVPIWLGSDPEGKQALARMIVERSNALTIITMEGPEHTVRAMRVVGLSHEIIAHLAPALNQPDEEGAMEERIENGQRWFADALAVEAQALARQEFPWQ